MFRTFGGIVDMRRQPDNVEVEQQPKVHLRRELRQPLTVLKATNNSGPKTLFGYACNISRSGMLISTINPRKPDPDMKSSSRYPSPPMWWPAANARSSGSGPGPRRTSTGRGWG